MLVCTLLLIAGHALTVGWQPIFNGKDLSGWTAKIKGFELGDNFANTFRVRNGCLVVDYSGYSDKFENRFGFLFYKDVLSKYRIRMEYRFVGDQLSDGPGWAYQNSGIMIHGQDPKTMDLNQDFPVSAEVQLLGGDGKNERHTGNVCTPGTHIVLDGKLDTRHCIDSTSKTFPRGEWVRIEIEVLGDGKVTHWVNDEKVMEYESIQLDPGDGMAKKLIRGSDVLLRSGTISLQSESHPIEFRKIELLRL